MEVHLGQRRQEEYLEYQVLLFTLNQQCSLRVNDHEIYYC